MENVSIAGRGRGVNISAMGMCRRGVKAVLNVFLRLNVVVGVE